MVYAASTSAPAIVLQTSVMSIGAGEPGCSNARLSMLYLRYELIACVTPSHVVKVNPLAGTYMYFTWLMLTLSLTPKPNTSTIHG